jgi:hypothetical protein
MPADRSTTEEVAVKQWGEGAKLKRMLQGPDYCLQVFLEAVMAHPGPQFRRRRIHSARAYRLAAWPLSSPRRIDRRPHPPFPPPRT